jgi:hypothetical protein
MDEAKRCPRSHSDEVLPIVYGLPGPEMVEESAAGRVVLGGVHGMVRGSRLAV